MAGRLCVRSMCRVVLQQSAIARYPQHVTPIRSFAVYYTEDHEWVNVTGNKAVIGITDHAQDSLGDVVYVELPDVGTEIEVGEEFCSVESVKAVGEVIAPLDGVVTKVNETLSENPQLINDEPEAGGWIVEVELSDESQLDDLMDKEGYQRFLTE